MANPFQTPVQPPQRVKTAPNWYVVFCQFYKPAWFIGSVLIVLSWFNIVSPTVGWIGFGLACASTFAAYILPSIAGFKPEDYVVLDSHLLASKDKAYDDAMERFYNGARLAYDGVAFGFRPNSEIACGIVSHSPDIDETEAIEIAGRAQSVFEDLCKSSEQFAAAVAGYTFRVSVMSGYAANATELFRFVDGNIQRRA